MVRSSLAASSLVIFFLSLPAPGARAGELDRRKLAELAKLPEVQNVFWASVPEETLRSLLEHLLRIEVADLEKSLARDSNYPDRWNRLAELFGVLRDQEKEKAAGDRAVDLCRMLLEKDPRNPHLLAGLGEALDRKGRAQEAEEVLRKAIDLGLAEWRGWSAFADLLGRKSLHELSNGVVEDWIADANAQVQSFARLAEIKDGPARLDRGKKIMDEASSAYDRAVACAPPGDAEPYRRRGMFRYRTQAIFRCLIRILEGGEREFQKIYLEEMKPLDGAVADLEEVARRRPDDCYATWQAAAAAMNAPRKDRRTTFLPKDMVPEERRAALREAMARLEKQSLNTDRVAAASALEMLALVRFYFEDEPGAEQSARAALAIDPTREASWNLLVYLFGSPDQAKKLITLLRERPEVKDTPQIHYRLAVLLAEAEPDEAEKELEAALRLDPDDFEANLGMAALKVRRSKGGNSWGEAVPFYMKAEVLYQRASTQDKWRKTTILRAILNGLNGYDGLARTDTEAILEREPGNEDAKAAWAALGGRPMKSPEREEAVAIDEARKYYQAHPKLFASKGQLEFRMIAVDKDDKDEEAKVKLDLIDADLEKLSFEATARKFYGDPKDDAEFHWKKSIESMDAWKQPILNQLLKMNPGEVKRRIRLASDTGWRYLELVARSPGGTMTFEEARPLVETMIRAERLKERIENALERK